MSPEPSLAPCPTARRRHATAAIAFALLAPAWTRAEAPAASAASAPAQANLAWLTRIQEATRRQNFQGTFVVSSGSNMSSARILHVCKGPDQYERIDALDGLARRVHRHNSQVQTLWPQSRTALVEERDTEPVHDFPGFWPAAGQRIEAHYEVKLQGVERVAGHEADVVWLQPRDEARFGHRLWVARPSGLLLRAEVVDERGEVLEWSAFSEVQIGGRIPLEQVVLSPAQLAGYTVRHGERLPTDLQGEGWTLTSTVPGFEQVSCVKRRGAKGGNETDMLQVIHSDGLTHVSMFIEPYQPGTHRRELLLTLGANRTLMMRRDGWWLTVMGDVPVSTLRSFAAGLERRHP